MNKENLKTILINHIKGSYCLTHYDKERLSNTRQDVDNLIEESYRVTKRFGLKFQGLPLKVNDLLAVRKDYALADEYLACLKNYYNQPLLQDSSLNRIKQILVQNNSFETDDIMNNRVNDYIKKLRLGYLAGGILSMIGVSVLTPLFIPFAVTSFLVGIATEVSSLNYQRTKRNINIVLEDKVKVKEELEKTSVQDIKTVLDENQNEICRYLK